MNIKKLFNIVSISIIFGFLWGTAVATIQVIQNRYYTYELYNLIISTYYEIITKAVLIAVLFAFFAIIFYFILYYLIQKKVIFKPRFAGSIFRQFFHFIESPLITATGFLLITGLIVFGTYRHIKAKRHINKPHVILVSIDDLRADHLSCYGYHRNTSPNIDLFAKKNFQFNNCFIHEAWTLTSHMSLLTGVYPMTHRVNLYTGTPLMPSFTTLAEFLKNNDYLTMAVVVGALFMHPKAGFYQGFDYYFTKDNYGGKGENADNQNLFIRQELKKHNTNNNLFVFIHYFDVHSGSNDIPYEAPPPYNRYFSSEFEDHIVRFSNTPASEGLERLNKKGDKLTPKQLEYLKATYDNGIAYMDKCIGDLFRMLKEMDMYDNSLIIITADHGEEFQEHGWFLHSNPLAYDELIHVPLLVKFPSNDNAFQTFRGRPIDALIESIDIMPSILDYLGIETSPPLEGKSFTDILEGNKPTKKYVFGLGSARNLYIRSHKWKLVGSHGLNKSSLKLFNLSNDPDEKFDQGDKNTQIKERLYNCLKKRIENSKELQNYYFETNWFDGLTTQNKKKYILDTNARKKLESLGYIQ